MMARWTEVCGADKPAGCNLATEQWLGEEGSEGHFEEDTGSFWLRRREFEFPGIPQEHELGDFALSTTTFGLEVILRQDFLCVEGTGGAVWRPSIRFAEFVCSGEGRRCLPIAGKSVLEISSGLGLGAIVAWHLGASKVVATDIDSDDGPMRLLTENIAANCGQISAPADGLERSEQDQQDIKEKKEACSPPLVLKYTPEDAVGGARWPSKHPPQVRNLRWGNRTQLEETLASFGNFGPDIVLACDVVFDETLLPALKETLIGACELRTGDGGRPVLCISHQRRSREREEHFFSEISICLGQGLEVHREGDVSVFLFSLS